MMTATQQQDDKQQQRLPLIIGLVAVIASVVGLLLVAKMVVASDPAVAVGTEAKGNDLSVWVDRFEWLDHGHGDDDDHDDGETVDAQQEAIDDLTAQAEVFAMPATMMPGTPADGFQRVQVALTIVNRGAATAAIGPDDFLLTSTDGDSWLAGIGGTFNPADLGQRQLFNTVVAFDVPDEQSTADMYLVWSWEGGDTRFALQGSGHVHG